MKEDVDLDALLASEIPETSWSVDSLGNLRCIDLVTDASDVVAHLCEFDEQSRRAIVKAMMEVLYSKEFECNYIAGTLSKDI